MPTLEELTKIRHPATSIEELKDMPLLLVGAERVNAEKDLWKAQLSNRTSTKTYGTNVFISPIVGTLLDRMVELSKKEQSFFLRKTKEGYPELYVK